MDRVNTQQNSLKIITFVIFIACQIFSLSSVVGNSMLPNISNESCIVYVRNSVFVPFMDIKLFTLIGERRQFPILFQFHRGDIILFHVLSGEKPRGMCKRVIGISGDKVSCVNGVLAINGKDVIHLKRSNDNNDEMIEVLPSGEEFAVRGTPRKDFDILVPSGHVFCMGDNRADSIDSIEFGYVNIDQIKGKVIYVFEQEISKLIVGITKPNYSQN